MLLRPCSRLWPLRPSSRHPPSVISQAWAWAPPQHLWASTCRRSRRAYIRHHSPSTDPVDLSRRYQRTRACCSRSFRPTRASTASFRRVPRVRPSSRQRARPSSPRNRPVSTLSLSPLSPLASTLRLSTHSLLDSTLNRSTHSRRASSRRCSSLCIPNRQVSSRPDLCYPSLLVFQAVALAMG